MCQGNRRSRKIKKDMGVNTVLSEKQHIIGRGWKGKQRLEQMEKSWSML